MKEIMLILALMLCCANALATEERFQLNTTEQKRWFIELGEELRCPKCQNQNIADSNATVSIDMKRKVHELLLEGKSKAEVIDYMKVRYGDFVHYQPPVNSATIVLWLMPVLMLMIGLLIIWSKGKAKKASLSQRDIEQADDLLGRNGGDKG